MMTRSAVLTILAISTPVASFLTSDAFSQEQDAMSNLIFIVAVPESVSFVKPVENRGNPSDIVIGSVYKVTLNSIQVIRGVLSRKHSLTVELTGSHRESISENREIFVLLKRKSNGDLEPMFWGTPQVVACVPRVMISGSNLAHAFEGFEGYDNTQCAVID